VASSESENLLGNPKAVKKKPKVMSLKKQKAEARDYDDAVMAFNKQDDDDAAQSEMERKLADSDEDFLVDSNGNEIPGEFGRSDFSSLVKSTVPKSERTKAQAKRRADARSVRSLAKKSTLLKFLGNVFTKAETNKA
jgi:hypothetical protein